MIVAVTEGGKGDDAEVETPPHCDFTLHILALLIDFPVQNAVFVAEDPHIGLVTVVRSNVVNQSEKDQKSEGGEEDVLDVNAVAAGEFENKPVPGDVPDQGVPPLAQ